MIHWGKIFYFFHGSLGMVRKNSLRSMVIDSQRSRVRDSLRSMVVDSRRRRLTDSLRSMMMDSLRSRLMDSRRSMMMCGLLGRDNLLRSLVEFSLLGRTFFFFFLTYWGLTLIPNMREFYQLYQDNFILQLSRRLPFAFGPMGESFYDTEFCWRVDCWYSMGNLCWFYPYLPHQKS